MAPSNHDDPGAFPVVKAVLYGPQTKSTPAVLPAGVPATYYGVYFYPFTKDGEDPVFAVVGGVETIVARPHDTKGIEIIQYFRDDAVFKEALCTACWTKDKQTGDPLLAVGGQAGIIKILNVKTGKVVQTLSGHGDEIMGIVMSPLDQSLLASCAADQTVRIWSIGPRHQKQPCALMCAGEGHRETILSIAFHASGRYLLSGGMDHIINLWVIPDLPDQSTGSDSPITLMYPHFSTSMIHSNYIDCIAFHGDYILSKAAREGKIVLWAIQNFTSKVPPPSPDKAPTTHEWQETRSAFGGSFERILQFNTPDTEPFFMHFGFFSQPYKHPMLVMGSTVGKVSMWDLTRIEKHSRGPGVSSREDTTPSDTGNSAARKGTPRSKGDDVSELFGLIKAHEVMDIPKVKTTIRDIAWSPRGDYMVLVGEYGIITLCKRWN